MTEPIIPLPKPTSALLNRVLERDKNVHPGLLLDKFSAICIPHWKTSQDRGENDSNNENDDREDTTHEPKFQELQRNALKRVKEASSSFSNNIHKTTLDRRKKYFQESKKNKNVAVFQCKTISPLTIDLSHPSSLENAGIGLHPLYGFLYLPGSSIKGMARAYAETLWLPKQENKQEAEKKILSIFGNDPDERKEENFCAGKVIFHDAWPESQPALDLDIVNNHHNSYYDNKMAPGDWEDPVMVSFLCIKEGIIFEFAISLNSPCKDESLLTQAKEWLLGALCHIGAGAKTSAGYGYFYPVEGDPPTTPRKTWKPDQTGNGPFEVEIELDLITPAFLGGADKNASPILRLSSLDGILRKWWRAWHSDLKIEGLHKRESEIFGSIDTGVQLSFAPPFSGLHKLKTDNIQTGQEMEPWERSLAYLGYGPIEYTSTKQALWFGQSLLFRLFHNSYHAMEEILKSLWLLCALGGIGSRNRRGWGSVMLKGAIVEKLGKLGLPNLGKCQTIEDYVNSLNKGLLSLVTKQNRQSAKDLEWTSIGSDMDIIISSKPFAKGKDALLDIGRKFQGFRSWDRRGHFENKAGIDHDHTFDYFDTQLFGNEKDKNKATLPIPERSAFGMPYTQSFSSLKRKLNSEKLPAITFTPEWEENGNKTTGRRASPLFFKIVKIDTKSEQFFWQVVYLPYRFLPQGAEIKVERTDLDQSQL